MHLRKLWDRYASDAASCDSRLITLSRINTLHAEPIDLLPGVLCPNEERALLLHRGSQRTGEERMELLAKVVYPNERGGLLLGRGSTCCIDLLLGKLELNELCHFIADHNALMRNGWSF
ncbi:hypothetical protein KM043_012839 [Ampulex compressa]|nr:hypothetical protein KM043_012839 [Ampulex compressa]